MAARRHPGEKAKRRRWRVEKKKRRGAGENFHGGWRACAREPAH
jgi:hypothetical protein